VFGAVADRWGPGRVIVLGALLLAAGCALTTQVTSEWGLIVAIGVMSAAGAGAGSFSILIGATAQHIPAERRSFAGGVINAGGSLGQFIFAPLNQAVLSAFGWMQAMWMMAAVALTTAPMAWWLRGSASSPLSAGTAPAVTN
jgi:MFS family permease